MYIDEDGSVNLTLLLLGSSYSVDVIASADNDFFGDDLENALGWVDSRLRLRCIIAFNPESVDQKAKVNELERLGWDVRVAYKNPSADTLIVDGEHSVLATDQIHPSNGKRILHYATNLSTVQQIKRHFEYLWQESADLLYEDLLQSSIPANERQIITISRNYWDDLFASINKDPENLYTLDPRKFEELVAELLDREGFAVKITPPTRDGGRDILAYTNGKIGEHLYLVECKRYASHRLSMAGKDSSLLAE